MSLELIYTSVPRGLSPGSNGFCTAAATGGMSRQIVAKLESLSGYQFYFNLSDPRAAENPVNWAHTQVRIGAETLGVLSRIAYCGADYSNRTNKIAHHFLLERGEQSPNGPAWMLMAMAENKVLLAGYGVEPCNLPKRDLRTLIPAEVRPPEPATTWQAMTGDAGWAGTLAKAFRENPKVPAFVIFAPGQELLPLFEEALALLPPEERWQVGFATYYTALPAGCQYHWLGVIAGSSAAKEMQRFPNATVIDLTTALGQAPDNMFTQAARTGAVLPPVRAPERPKIKVVERAPQPVPLAAEVVREADNLTWAMEAETRGRLVDTGPTPPSPAQLRWLIRRARRARWVPVLLAAVFLLVVSTLVSTSLHFYNPWRSAPPAPGTVVAVATSAPPVKAAVSVPGEPQVLAPKVLAQEGPPRGAASEKGEVARKPDEELSLLLDSKNAVEKAASDAKNQTEIAATDAKGAKDILNGIPKQIDADNLGEARQKLDAASATARSARQAAEESKKQQDEAKKQADEVGQKADNLLKRVKDDANTKDAVKDAKEKAKEAEKNARQFSQDADKRAHEAEDAVRQAKSSLDAAEKQINDALARAPEVEAKPRPRDNPWQERGGGVLGQVNRQVLWPSSVEENPRVFPLQGGRKFAFLELPPFVSAKVAGFETQQTGNVVTLNVTVQAGLDQQKLFITSKINEKCRVSCQILEVPNMPLDLVAIRDWLVIEVADLDAKRVQQCPLGGRKQRISKEVALGYDLEGKPERPDPIRFVYPWPDMLTVQIGNKKAERMQGAGMSRDCPLELRYHKGSEEIKVDVVIKISIKQSDNHGYVLEYSVEGLRNAIDAAVLAVKYGWAAARQDLDVVEKQLGNIEKNAPKNDDKKSLLEKKSKAEKSLSEFEKTIQSLLDAAKRVPAQDLCVRVCDPWGIPVVDLGFKFTGEAATVMKAKTREPATGG